MAFPTGWNRKCKITFDHTKVAETIVNDAWLLTEVNLPSEMFDADGQYPALNGGGDIRCSTDSAGATEIARHIVSFVTDNNPALGTAQIWVNIPSLSSSVDTDIYVWYNNPSATEPAVDSAYGQYNTYNSNVKASWHLEESGNGTGDEYKDSTHHQYHGTGQGGIPNQIVGKIKNGQEIVGSSADKINCGNVLNITTESFTLEFWFRKDASSSTFPVLFSKGYWANSGWEVQIYPTTEICLNTYEPAAKQTTTSDFNIATDGTWYMCHITKNGTGSSNVSIYKNGIERGYDTRPSHGNIASSSYNFTIGQGPYWLFDGALDNLSVIFDEVFSANRCLTRYNNQNSPATFVSAGTPEAGIPLSNFWYLLAN